MNRSAGAFAILLWSLTSCVAAIGNKGNPGVTAPKVAASILAEQVEVARRIVDLRERQVEEVRLQRDAGRAGTIPFVEAQIALEEARLRLLCYRAELESTRTHVGDREEE